MTSKIGTNSIREGAPERSARYRLCVFTKNRSDAQRLTCRECLDSICMRLFEIGLDDNRQPLPWNDSPECGVRNRSGQPCRLQVVPGQQRCRLHGRRSPGPTSQAGTAKIAGARRRRGHGK